MAVFSFETSAKIRLKRGKKILRLKDKITLVQLPIGGQGAGNWQ